MRYSKNVFNKYSARKTNYNGRMYDSKYEAEIAYELDMRRLAGEFKSVVPQFPIQLYIYDSKGNKIELFKYVCDFKCELPDGSFQLIEAKGFRTDTYKMKKKLLELIWLKDNKNYEFIELTKE